MNYYFDTAVGDMRSRIQGILTVESAATISLGDSEVLGNVYLEYEMEFFGEELDYDVNDIQTVNCTLSGSATTGALADGGPIVAKSSAIAAGYLNIAFDQLPTDVQSVGDLGDYAFYGIVTSATGDFVSGAASQPGFKLDEDQAYHSFTTGQGFIIPMDTIIVSGSAVLNVGMFSNFEAISPAHGFAATTGNSQLGQLEWDAQVGAPTFTQASALTICGRWFQIA